VGVRADRGRGVLSVNRLSLVAHYCAR
jgi:hypothetical protein